MHSFSIILKYELKSFRNYLFQKSLRIIGFILGLFLELAYIYTLFFVIKPSFIKPIIIHMKSTILNSLPGAIFIIILFSFSAGSSLIVTVRKGIRNKLEIYLIAPKRPLLVLLMYLLIQALAVTSLLTEIFLPIIIWVLLGIGIDVMVIIAFALNLIAVILTFSFLGALTSLAYTRLGHKKRMIMSIIIMAFVMFIYYIMIYGYSAFRGEINFILSLLNSDYSPVRWFLFPLLIDMQPLPKTIAFALGNFAFIIILSYASFRTISGKFFKGELRPPVELFRYRVKGGIIDKLFRPPLRGMLKKEIRGISREPLLLNLLLFGPLMIIVLTFIFVIPTYSTGGYLSEFTLLSIIVFYSSFFIMLSTNYYAVSLSVERRALATIFSSPIDLKFLVKVKSIIILLVESLTGLAQIAIIILMLPISTSALYLIFEFLMVNILLSIGIGSYIGIKYVNIKADNPRRALERIGSLMSSVSIFIITFFNMLIIVTYYFLSKLIGYILVSISIIMAFIILQLGMKEATKALNSIEITEY